MALVRLGAPETQRGPEPALRPADLLGPRNPRLNALTPSNANEAPAGRLTCCLAVDAAGVPSVASPVISVQRTPAGPRPPTNLALNRTATGRAACATTEAPAKAVDGSVLQRRVGQVLLERGEPGPVDSAPIRAMS